MNSAFGMASNKALNQPPQFAQNQLRPQHLTNGAGQFSSQQPMVNGFMKQNSNVNNDIPQNSFLSENVNMMGGIRNQMQVQPSYGKMMNFIGPQSESTTAESNNGGSQQENRPHHNNMINQKNSQFYDEAVDAN